jgi:hypothetical protein
MDINLSNQGPVQIEFGVKVIDVARAISYMRFDVDDTMHLTVNTLNANSESDLTFSIDDGGNLIVSEK